MKTLKGKILSFFLAVLAVGSMCAMTVFAAGQNSVSITLRTDQSVARAGHTTEANQSCSFKGNNNASSKHGVWLIPKYCEVGGSWHDYDTKEKLMDVGTSVTPFTIKNPREPHEIHWSVELKVFLSMEDCSATASATLQ